MLKYEQSKSAWNYITDILKDIPNPTIFELGVHWSEDTKKIMNLCNGYPDYHGFEPDPRNIRKIKQKKGLKYVFSLFEGAVGNIDGIVDLHLSEGIHKKSGNKMTGANSIRKPKKVLSEYDWIKFNKTTKVECVRLDTYCKRKGINHIDFIWSDIQGAEYDMILGGKEILSKTKYVILEYSNLELYAGQKKIKDYLKLLQETGDWEIVHTFPIDVLLQNKSLLK